MSFAKLTASALAIAAVSATAAAARDQVQVAGSSTVLPYASIVAEAFGENFDFPTPVVESGGSSAGLKRFCEGVGENTIDIANASRQIRENEIAACAENGVTDIIEVRIGYDGIVFASRHRRPGFTAFTPADCFNALAAERSSTARWSTTRSHMGSTSTPICPAQHLAFIPGTKHGTREVFEEKVILQAAKTPASCRRCSTLALTKTTPKAPASRPHRRQLGRYRRRLHRDAGPIDSNKNGIGVFGLAFYENNTDKLKVATMAGVAPSTETISTGEYPVSRPLFFYVKKAHIGVIPGLKEFAEFFVSDEIAGPDGPLAAYGLVSDPELAATQAAVADETDDGRRHPDPRRTPPILKGLHARPLDILLEDDEPVLSGCIHAAVTGYAAYMVA